MSKTNYPKLENLVEKLDNIAGNDEAATAKRIQALQEIGKMLINNYKIAIDDVVAEPLLVEAYYKSGEFDDANCHGDPKQKGASRFGKLYLHNKGRGGVDICLPLGEYYLSFLIKVAKIGQETKKQVDIYDKLSSVSGIEDRGDILIYRPGEKDHCVVCMPRKNTDKGNFAKAPLAIVSLDSFKGQEEKKKIAAVTIQSLEHGRQWTVAKYGLEKAIKEYEQKEQSNNENAPDVIENRAREIVKKGNLYSDKIEDKYIKEAWEYIKGEEN